MFLQDYAELQSTSESSTWRSQLQSALWNLQLGGPNFKVLQNLQLQSRHHSERGQPTVISSQSYPLAHSCDPLYVFVNCVVGTKQHSSETGQ